MKKGLFIILLVLLMMTGCVTQSSKNENDTINLLSKIDFKTSKEVKADEDVNNVESVGNNNIGFVDLPIENNKFIDITGLQGDGDKNLKQWTSNSSDWILSLSVYDSEDVISYYNRTATNMLKSEGYHLVDEEELKVYVLVESDISTGRWVVIYSLVSGQVRYFSFETYSENASLLTEPIVESYINHLIENK